jgi:imidazolonepropionase
MRSGGAAFGEVADGAVAVTGGLIDWVGTRSELPTRDVGSETVVHDAEGAWLTPGLIDCHTHLVFGGDRADEFEARLQGASYAEIAQAGGGIRSTVRATREASLGELEAGANARADQLLRQGVTTLEIKSGYGMDVATEVAMLRAARSVSESLPLTVRTTLLALHTLPVEFDGRREDFISLVVEELLPTVVGEGLVDAVDAFCEGIAFTPDECATFFRAAADLGLPVRLHADQLSDTGGAALAASFSALSADHLEYTSEEGVRAMAAAGTVAVLLPGAFYFLRETRTPPVDALREHGVPIALATDANPGSSPILSLLTILNMGCTLFRLTPEEALAGVTRNAARVLGLGGEAGTLEPGKRADLALWDVTHPRELAYWIGTNPCRSVIKAGVEVGA